MLVVWDAPSCMHKRHGPENTAPANKPGSHQHPLDENRGAAPQRGSDQSHLRGAQPLPLRTLTTKTLEGRSVTFGVQGLVFSSFF